MNCFMILSQRYGGSKGVRDHRLGEPPLGNLAPPGDLEDSASHHQGYQQGSKGSLELSVEDGLWGNLAPLGDLEESASHHDLTEKSQDISDPRSPSNT